MTAPLGLRSGTVRLVAYDGRWPAAFAAEAERIRAAAGDLPLELEHVGSTAVPGLAAKPVIDILGGRPAGAAADPYIAALQQAGYEHRGAAGIAARNYFRRGVPRTHHVHLVEVGSAFWRDHLAFRDRLRAHPHLAAEYAALKQALAARFAADRERYTEAKGPFVARVLGEPAGPGSGTSPFAASGGPGEGRRR